MRVRKISWAATKGEKGEAMKRKPKRGAKSHPLGADLCDRCGRCGHQRRWHQCGACYDWDENKNRACICSRFLERVKKTMPAKRSTNPHAKTVGERVAECVTHTRGPLGWFVVLDRSPVWTPSAFVNRDVASKNAARVRAWLAQKIDRAVAADRKRRRET